MNGAVAGGASGCPVPLPLVLPPELSPLGPSVLLLLLLPLPLPPPPPVLDAGGGGDATAPGGAGTPLAGPLAESLASLL